MNKHKHRKVGGDLGGAGAAGPVLACRRACMLAWIAEATLCPFPAFPPCVASLARSHSFSTAHPPAAAEAEPHAQVKRQAVRASQPSARALHLCFMPLWPHLLHASAGPCLPSLLLLSPARSPCGATSSFINHKHTAAVGHRAYRRKDAVRVGTCATQKCEGQGAGRGTEATRKRAGRVASVLKMEGIESASEKGGGGRDTGQADEVQRLYISKRLDGWAPRQGRDDRAGRVAWHATHAAAGLPPDASPPSSTTTSRRSASNFICALQLLHAMTFFLRLPAGGGQGGGVGLQARRGGAMGGAPRLVIGARRALPPCGWLHRLEEVRCEGLDKLERDRAACLALGRTRSAPVLAGSRGGLRITPWPSYNAPCCATPRSSWLPTHRLMLTAPPPLHRSPPATVRMSPK